MNLFLFAFAMKIYESLPLIDQDVQGALICRFLSTASETFINPHYWPRISLEIFSALRTNNPIYGFSNHYSIPAMRWMKLLGSTLLRSISSGWVMTKVRRSFASK